MNRLLPPPHEVASRRGLRLLGARLEDPGLWHLNRRSTATGAAIGLFFAFLPIPGHMLLAAPTAVLARANVLVAIAAVWVTNPLTIAPMFYAAYRVGAWLLGTPPQPVAFGWSARALTDAALVVGEPLVVGCVLFAIGASAMGYLGVRIAWRWHAVRRWRARSRGGVRRR
ncbi:MAG: DUF2062 domain-containing protein [Gammaproteobacteria bacterium]